MCSYFLISGSVSFQGTTVTLTCPNEDIYSGFEWKKEYKIIENKKQATYSLPKYTNKEDGLYSCTGTEESSGESITHYFYIKAKGKCKSKIHEDLGGFFQEATQWEFSPVFCVLSCKNNVNYNRCNFQILSNHWC